MIKNNIVKIVIIILFCFAFLSKTYYSISSPSAVVICEDTGRILYDKNANEVRPMASLTKLMTAIIFVENCKMNESIDVDEKACFIGGSEVGLRPNTKITAKDLRGNSNCTPSFRQCRKLCKINEYTSKRNGAKRYTFCNSSRPR